MAGIKECESQVSSSQMLNIGQSECSNVMIGKVNRKELSKEASFILSFAIISYAYDDAPVSRKKATLSSIMHIHKCDIAKFVSIVVSYSKLYA